ncbi:SDR family oxidoreductase [Kineosporia succinea]|uniref:Uncharacterized protein YbjT (DUF2867 family) n=1 Tax=Kineosporia succinea TaxID=84632 RepID=A0ABT9P2K2_9ACTN|nr:SDR family oxidoreductase [Kineosporia succinea]MDP9826914.1 uncharacterized protein YbjT (DUF2867 family) [Kineosporia succinea]
MKIVVLGGSGLIGAQLVEILRGQGHQVVPASRSTGVDVLTGSGLELEGAEVVVDVLNSPSFADDDVLRFFTTSTATVLEKASGVKHYVVLSIVGTDGVPGSGYLRAKAAQEELVRASGIPFSIVRATQFFEFAPGVAAMSTDAAGTVRLPTDLVQPIAAAEVARILAGVVVGSPVGQIDIAGPERFGLDEYVRRAAPGTPVVTDPEATYAGAKLQPTSLVPVGDAVVSEVSLESWQQAGAR